MRGLIARILAGQAPLAPADPLAATRADLDAAIRQRRAERLARDTARQSQRFEHARPKVEQLRHEIAMRAVIF